MKHFRLISIVVSVYTLLSAGFLLGMAFNRAVKVRNPFAPRRPEPAPAPAPAPKAASSKPSSSFSPAGGSLSGSRPTFGK